MGEFHAVRASEVLQMARTFEQITAKRRVRMGPEAQARREVFARAYESAVQVMVLREKLGLTQAELAERCGVGEDDIRRIEHGSVYPDDISLLVRGLTSPTVSTLDEPQQSSVLAFIAQHEFANRGASQSAETRASASAEQSRQQTRHTTSPARPQPPRN